MPWKQQGGGGGGPWGGSGGGGGGGQWGGGGSQAPDFEEMLRKGQDKFKRFMPSGLGGGKGIALVLIGVFALWMLSGFYRVQPDEQGVVLRFGKWVATTQPGLNYHLPSPFESVITPSVTRINKIEVGLRSVGPGGRGVATRDIPEESLMLTGDENIVDVDFSVLWVVKDAGKFLFNIRDPERTVKIAAESAMRSVIGQKPILAALTEGRDEIQQETQARAQKHLDEYGAGIEIREVQMQKIDPPAEVIDAFIDVQRAAADLERLRNEAEAYRNDILPRARGEAEKVIQAANAYMEQIVNKAQGEAQRYEAIYASYQAAKEVTKQRMYLETMEEVFAGTTKVIIDPTSKGGTGVVPYLPLPEIRSRSRQNAGNDQ